MGNFRQMHLATVTLESVTSIFYAASGKSIFEHVQTATAHISKRICTADMSLLFALHPEYSIYSEMQRLRSVCLDAKADLNLGCSCLLIGTIFLDAADFFTGFMYN